MLRYKPNKNLQDSYAANYKTLVKERKPKENGDNMFMDWKTHYC